MGQFKARRHGAAAVRAVHVPVLIMQGQADRMQPFTEADILFEAANDPKQKELIDTGHLPHLEKPELVAGILARWFRE